MSPNDMQELRALLRTDAEKSAKQIGALHKKIDPLVRQLAKMEQWMEDKACERHDHAILQNQKDINDLKIKNVSQDGNVKLKVGVMQFLALIIASLITMTPVALALINYVNKLAEAHGGP